MIKPASGINFGMVKGRIVEIKKATIIVKPMILKFGMGMIVCNLNRLRCGKGRKPAVGDVIYTFNVIRNKRGWKAERGFLAPRESGKASKKPKKAIAEAAKPSGHRNESCVAQKARRAALITSLVAVLFSEL